ncbi:hypothetical protein SCAR479_09490 [Seiridium cardinale]|uniref:Uncharacterized protein n=1 Tax=Seiridium cardinale TaxID=138064 RepID=A0ABR2XJ92_9PEZI
MSLAASGDRRGRLPTDPSCWVLRPAECRPQAPRPPPLAGHDSLDGAIITTIYIAEAYYWGCKTTRFDMPASQTPDPRPQMSLPLLWNYTKRLLLLHGNRDDDSSLRFAPTATMNPWTPHTRVPITRQLNGHAAGMAAQVRNNAGLCERWSYADHDGLAYRRGPLSPIISSAAALGRSLTGGIKDAIDLTIARLQSASEEGGGGGGKPRFGAGNPSGPD